VAISSERIKYDFSTWVHYILFFEKNANLTFLNWTLLWKDDAWCHTINKNTTQHIARVFNWCSCRPQHQKSGIVYFTVLKWSLGKYFNFMAVLEILLFQIRNKTNLTLRYLTNLEPPSLTLPGAIKRHQTPPNATFCSPKT